MGSEAGPEYYVLCLAAVMVQVINGGITVDGDWFLKGGCVAVSYGDDGRQTHLWDNLGIPNLPRELERIPKQFHVGSVERVTERGNARYRDSVRAYAAYDDIQVADFILLGNRIILKEEL